MARSLRLVVGLLLLAAMFGLGWVVAKARVGSSVSRASLSDLERQFTDRMKGVALVGHFTIVGRGDRPPIPERYEISSAEKVGDNEWRFNARIKYGKIDTALPIVVTMVWAGDTPMITMTEVAIPTLGTFSARVLFYGDRYAGTWQHGDQGGGHMFGRIEKVANP